MIGVEWETGILPSEKSGDGADPYFPKWAWPVIGDRLWVDGHWVFDCGHGSDIGGVERFRTEIHPPRALAAMRDQARPLPGTGSSAVPVTATDLYIHGRGGYLVEMLHCGMGILLDGDACATKTTPIAEDFEFDVCLPPRPAAAAVLTTVVDDGPDNTVAIAPILQEMPAAGPCVAGAEFDQGSMLRVRVPLAGSGVVPEDVYARRIYAGWVGGSQPPLTHLRLTLLKMNLEEDHDLDPGDGELTFFWMNVNRAVENEWIRLADFSDGNMNDYDDESSFGDGEMDFTGATFEFAVRQGQPFTIRATGYEQDCYDEHFGDHELTVGMYVSCHGGDPTQFPDGGNDSVATLPPESAPESTTFGPFNSPPYGIGTVQQLDAGEYQLFVRIEEVPPADDTAPTTTVTPSPPPNAFGWHNADVILSFAAADNDGGTGVQEIVFSAAGAQTVPPTSTTGTTTSLAITVEGETVVTYQARDGAGNLEEPKTLTIRLDKTAPVVTASRMPPPNVHGWNNTDVVATFTATDALSGIDGPASIDVTFTLEGANQGATRTFTDRAGNLGSATIDGINIDKTPPRLDGLPAEPCLLWPPDHRLAGVGEVTVVDDLSGVLPGSFAVSGASNEPENGLGDGDTAPDIVIEGGSVSLRVERAGGGTGRLYTISATAEDLAGNVGTAAGRCLVPRSSR
jgi:hypothetical protein